MVILIGEGGTGKTTILNELVKRGYKKPINNTTRPKREDDENTKEYNFVTKEEFEKMWKENKLLQRAEFNGEYYGLDINSLKDDIACVSIVDSVKDIKKRQKELGKEDMNLKVFYITIPEEERRERMLKRGDSEEKINQRIQIDNNKFKEARTVSDYVIENINLNETVNKIIELAK